MNFFRIGMTLPTCLVMTALITVGHAQTQTTSLTIKQLANPEKVNRNPVISETGLIAWTSYGEGLPDDGGGTVIYYYLNGTTGSVANTQAPYLAMSSPTVYQDTLLWQSTRVRDNLQDTWVLKEVPDDLRDTPYIETPALYRSQLAQGVNPNAVNINLNPEYQLHSGPYSNAFDYSHSRAPGRFSLQTNLLDRAVADLDDPRLLAANPYTLSETNDFNTNLVVNLETNNLARRSGSGLNEIFKWTPDEGVVLLTHDGRNDFAPSMHGDLITWQKAKYFPFGWEIMVLDGNTRMQLTTNFYYDMAPQAYDRQVVWYGWDGNDYEIYLWNADTKIRTQITSNNYDDVSPVIWENMIAWEGYISAEADIFLYQDGVIKQLSDNYEDDINPRIWNGQVVWQGFDGDDFEIYHFNGDTSTKLTTNDHDDILPDIRDGLITWMGYAESWDAEIYYTRDGQTIDRLTDNDYEDRDPKTSQGRIVWQADDYEKSLIFLAEP